MGGTHRAARCVLIGIGIGHEGSHMAMSVKDLIQRIRPYNPALRGVHGTFRFEIDDAGVFRVVVDDGNVRGVEGDGPADVVLGCSEPDFVDLMEGRRNAFTALLQGRLRASGNVQLVKLFHAFARRADGGDSTQPGGATP
jgi:putative sterol carrier protein